MLAYNEVKEKRYIVLEGAPYEVLSSHVFRKQQRKPVNATKLKHLVTGKVVEHSFAASDKVAEAEISERPVTYLYYKPSLAGRPGEYWFCETKNKSQRFKLAEDVVGPSIKFAKPNSELKLLSFDNQPLGTKIPVKMLLKVKEATPAIRGNTVQGGTKKVVLETGAELNVPMFINEGDTVIVNTETGQYVERGGSNEQ